MLTPRKSIGQSYGLLLKWWAFATHKMFRWNMRRVLDADFHGTGRELAADAQIIFLELIRKSSGGANYVWEHIMLTTHKRKAGKQDKRLIVLVRRNTITYGQSHSALPVRLRKISSSFCSLLCRDTILRF